jgi:oligoendopeptidase F
MMEFHANDIEITGKSEDIEESVIDEATKIGKMSRYDIEDKIMKIAKVMKGVKKPYDEIEQSLSDYLKKLFKQLNKLEESVINEDKKITEAAEKIFDALVNARVTKKPYKRIAMKVIEFQLRAIRFGGL